MLDHAVLLPSDHYHDNIEQYDKQEVLTAMKKELGELRQKDMYVECALRNNYGRLSKPGGLWGTDQIPLELQLQEFNQQVKHALLRRATHNM